MNSQPGGLGRRYWPDDRDGQHPMLARLPERVVRRNKTWNMRYVLDQGQTGRCVGFGLKAWMLCAPITQTTPDAEPTADTLYREACLRDEWPSNDQYDPQAGSSVRGGFKALATRGLVAEYVWAASADQVADWLCSSGPVVIGVPFYESMFNPNADGMLKVSGNVVGGHCMCLIGWSETRGAVRLVNSWSRGWGQSGRAWLRGTDLERLLNEDGEAAAGLEVLKGA